MSFSAVSWVVQNTVAPAGTPRYVMVLMANFAGEHGYCWPSIDTIAKLAGIHRRQVFSTLKLLVEIGELQCVENRSAIHRTNVYRVLCGQEPSAEADAAFYADLPITPVQSTAPGGVRSTAPTPVQSTAPQPISKNKEDSKSLFDSTESPPIAPQLSAEASFEVFWRIYPRHVGKDGARKAWVKALARASSGDIIKGLNAQLADLKAREAQYVPHPSTWLNRGDWQNDAPPPDDDFGPYGSMKFERQ